MRFRNRREERNILKGRERKRGGKRNERRVGIGGERRAVK